MTSASSLKELMAKHSIRFSKSLGQNFLIDNNICENIANFALLDRVVDEKNINIIEIGPGLGTLTEKLAIRAKKLLAVEIDKTLIPALKETLQRYDNISILNEDILKLDIIKLIKESFPEDEDVIICSNLPYCITSPVIVKLLTGNGYDCKNYNIFKSRIKSIVFLLQKEAAERLCANPPSREVGAISYLVSYFSKAKLGFKVSKKNFIPPPKVDSRMLKLSIRNSAAVETVDESFLFNLIRAAFQQRRKNICNSLSAGLNLNKSIVSETLQSVDINPNSRAEELSLEQFSQLSDIFYSLRRQME